MTRSTWRGSDPTCWSSCTRTSRGTTGQGRGLALGDSVVLQLGPGMPRCRMVGLAQVHEGLPADPYLLRTLGLLPGVELGSQATVLRGGTVAVGDPVVLS